MLTSVGREPLKSHTSVLQPRVVEARVERVVPAATCLPWQSRGTHVSPESLYEDQLEKRHAGGEFIDP